MPLPGPTLNDCKDPARRVLRLREIRSNLRAQVTELLHKILIITREIREAEKSV